LSGVNLLENSKEDVSLKNVSFRKIYKIIIVGDPKVGKSSIIERKQSNKFNDEYIPTLGATIKTEISTIRNTEIKMKLWDVSGQEKFINIRKMYYDWAKGFLIIFDLTKEESLINVRKWYNEYIEKADKPKVILLIGNKLDLKAERVVDKNEAAHLANEIEAKYLEASAKTGENIKELFNVLTNELLN
jgi:small GTP-binding protein